MLLIQPEATNIKIAPRKPVNSPYCHTRYWDPKITLQKSNSTAAVIHTDAIRA